MRATIHISLFLILLTAVFSGCGHVSSQVKQAFKVTMRDGTGLTTDIWFPDGEGSWPGILIRTPYGKNNKAGYGKFFSKHGYIVAIQEVRGTGSSEGDFDLWMHEKEDGYDAVEWLAEQKWSTGKVGMVGGSYDGYAQLVSAVAKPPHLVTIIPIVTMGDPSVNHVYPGGVFHTSQHLQALSIFKRYESRPSGTGSLPSGWKKQLDTLPVKLLIGPWSHHSLGKSTLGEYDFGEEAKKNLKEIELRWFDYWLKGEENGIMDDPLVELFAVGPNNWITGETYPLPETDPLVLYLAESDVPGKGILRSIPPPEKKAAYSSYLYDPGDPTPSIWFSNYPEWEDILATRKDILIFESAPTENEITILGPVDASIFASSSAPDTDWFIYYFLIDEEGNAFPLVGRGMLRARYRDQGKGAQLLEKNTIYPFHPDLWHSSFTLEPGWKIRTVICSAASPDFSRNLNTGGDNESGTEYIKADQKIYHDKNHPSSIMFHIVTSD